MADDWDDKRAADLLPVVRSTKTSKIEAQRLLADALRKSFARGYQSALAEIRNLLGVEKKV